MNYWHFFFPTISRNELEELIKAKGKSIAFILETQRIHSNDSDTYDIIANFYDSYHCTDKRKPCKHDDPDWQQTAKYWMQLKNIFETKNITVQSEVERLLKDNVFGLECLAEALGKIGLGTGFLVSPTHIPDIMRWFTN